MPEGINSGADVRNPPGMDQAKVRYHVLELVAGAIAVIALLSMMTLVFADVLCRYLFAAPIAGAYQLGSTFMVILLFAGLPVVTSQEAHLTVGFTDNLFPRRWKFIQRSAVNVLSGLVMAVVCWRLWEQAGYFTTYPEVLEVLDIPLAVFCCFMSVMSGLTTVIHLGVALRYARQLSAPAGQ